MNPSPAAGTRLILTPTTRLARAETRRRDEALARSAGAWPTPPVRPVHGWMAELREQALLTGALNAVPITTAQARSLWRRVIDGEIFVGEPRVAELAERAWRLVHEYRLEPPEAWKALHLSEDSARFREWAHRFQTLCREGELIDEWAFAGRLPGLVRRGALELPATVTLKGFELEPTPLLAALFEALTDAGVEVVAEDDPAPALSGPLPVTACADDDDELLAAARWARRRLEEAPEEPSVAIVVPDLAARLGRVERIFRAVFDPPGFALEERGTPAWHVSLGPPLADWPLVADALAFLELSPYRGDQPAAGRLLRCPWLEGWPEERDARAAAEARLMQTAPYAITLRELAGTVDRAGAVALARRLAAWRRQRDGHRTRAWPSVWAARFQQELAALGFGHGRRLDSREWQVLERWNRLLEDFAGLDLTTEAPLARRTALSLLRERAAATTFRERDPGCPIEILGVQEALGARFDAAWLATLDHETWPAAARREPLVPGPVQADVPASTPEGCRERAVRELAGLLRIAPDLRGSFSRGDDETRRERTRLVRAHERDAGPTELAGPGPELQVLAEDARAPALAADAVGGGTGVLRDQSACPFRAFAVHRLAARELRPPRPGLDAATRGTLIHHALEAFWRELPDQAALRALDDEALTARIAQAAGEAIDGQLTRHRLTLSAAGRALEQRCTERVLARWLDLEAQRGAFRVSACEAEIELASGPLTLRGRIDRVDETGEGVVLIDYKTGRAGRGQWLPEPRIVDPQLPAYALAWADEHGAPPAAIAFAQLRPDALRFDGLARTDVGIPRVDPLAEARHGWGAFGDFDALLDQWRATLTALARAFADGEAAVHPRRPDVCARCHLHALCRVHERTPLADDPESEQ